MTEDFEEITILGRPAILTDPRIDPCSIPGGYYRYEICRDNLRFDGSVEIARSILFNHWGTIIMRDRIRLPPNGCLHVKMEAIKYDTGDCQSMKESMEKYPPRTMPPAEHVR